MLELIPEWAIAVGVLSLFGAVAIPIMVRLLPPESRRRDTSDEQLRTLEDARARLGEIDDLTRRVAELEERVDFAERVLTTKREAERERLGPSRD